MKISVTILLKDAPAHIQCVVGAFKSFDEVLIYNNGGSESALNLCRQFPNVKIVTGTFIGFGPSHNLASSLAKNEWILSIDSDEVATLDLVQEIEQLELNDQTVYAIPRRNLYCGKWIQGCGWWPDYALRLYNKRYTQFSDSQVHESIKTEGMKRIFLKHPLLHYSYNSISDFLAKMQSYSDLFAKQWAGKKHSSPCKAALHGLFAFFKSYILKKGIFDGYPGFLISVYNGHTAFYKYFKLYEANLNIFRCPEEKASIDKSLDAAQK